MTTSPAQRFLNRRTRTEVPIKATLLTPEIAETVLAEKTKKHQKSQAYYDRTAKDLNELRPGDTVRVRPEGQEWKKGTVSQNCGYRSYDVNVDGKLLRRNRVHLKEDQKGKVTEPSSKSAEHEPTAEDLSAVVVEKNGKKVRPLKDTARAAEPAKCTRMELITVKRTRSGRLVKLPQRYSSLT